MATKIWLGTALAVKKKLKLIITGQPAGETFTVKVGPETIITRTHISGESSDDVVASMVTTWNNSVSPYATPITATAGGTGSGTMVLEADTAGIDFDVTQSVDVSGIVSFDKEVDRANKGPNDWSVGDNWLNVDNNTIGSIPASADDVVIKDSAVNIVWGLDQNLVNLTSLDVRKTYTGKIGLNRAVFATSADAETTVTTRTEYRPDYLKIGITTLELGKHVGPGSPVGSSRIKVNNVIVTAPTMIIHDTATTSAETGLPAVRLLANQAAAILNIKSAPGGVGIAVDLPGETSTLATITSDIPGTTGRLQIGKGTTLTTLRQSGGNNTLENTGTVTTVDVNGGILTTEGDFTITTLNVNAGEVVSNHRKTSGNAITTLNIEGGKVDFARSSISRTVATLNPNKGILVADKNSITFTTFNQPKNKYTLNIS